MVYAFIIRILFPGPVRILFYQIYGTDGVECQDNTDDKPDDSINSKQKIEFVAAQIHSEYQFRRTVSNRTIESDINQDDQLLEFELGFLRLSGEGGDVLNKERTVVWMGAGNTGFALVCNKKKQNRIVAETVLKLLVRYLQEYLKVLHQPAEVSLKADRVCLVLNKLLPEGNLIFMNHRVIRGLEKGLEIGKKS